MPELFNLHIRPLGGTDYSVDVTGRPEDGVPASFAETVALTASLKRLHDRSPNRPTFTIPQHDGLCSSIGIELFDAFIRSPKGVYAQYQQAAKEATPRVALHLPATLYKHPRETLRA